jgi:glycosyltransferase involved in cell wall biosynthesis
MRIAVIGSRGYPSSYGGFETFVRNLVPRAVAAGHEPVVYCRERPGRDRAWTVDGAMCVGTPGIDDPRLSTLSFGLTSCWDVRSRDVDAALAVNPANGFWLPLVRRAGVPVALNVDGLEWERGKWSVLGRAVFKAGAALCARHATRLVADSKAIADVWEERYGVRPLYIPYGAEVYADEDADELEALGIPPGGYTLTVARIVPENNVGITLEALDLLGDRRRPLHVIVGSGGGSRLEREIRSMVTGRDDVRHLGHVSNQRLLAQLFRHCLVYVHGHSVGGTNPALLEALGAGAPALAFDCAFNREVIGGDPDVYFDDAATLRDRLERLLDSPALREERSQRGRERIRTAYRWSEVCRSYLDLLTELAEKGASEPVGAPVRA